MYIFCAFATAEVTSHRLDIILKIFMVSDELNKYEFITENNITNEQIASVELAASDTLSTMQSDNEIVFFLGLIKVLLCFINLEQNSEIIIDDNKCAVSNNTPHFFEFNIPLPTATRINAGPALTQ